MDIDPVGLELADSRSLAEDSITIHLATPDLILESGGDPVDTLVTLTNPTQEDESDQYAFEVEGIDPAWYRLNVKSVLLQRGDSAQAHIRFAVPRRRAEPGIYTYRVFAQSLAHPLVQSTTVGQLRISSPPTLQMRLDPLTATGNHAQYTVHLLSGPNSDLVVDLTGRDPADMLAFTALPPRLRLSPNQEAEATLEVTIRAGVVGEARPYPFTLIADISAGSEGEAPIEADGVLVYVPEVQLDVQVDLTQMRGPRADYRITLTNPTSLTLGIELEAQDQGNPLDIFFSGENEDNIRLAPQSSVTLRALVLITEEVPPGETRSYQFSIGTQAHNVHGLGELAQVGYHNLTYQGGAGTGAEPAPPPRRNLLAPLSLILSPAEAEGDPAPVTVRVENGGPDGVLLVLDATDEAGALDYAFELPQLYVGPEGSAQTTLHVTLRADAPGAAAPETQSYPFVVRGWAPAGDETRLIAAGRLRRTYTAPVAQVFEALLLPVAPSGVEGSYDVRLTNGSGVPLRVVVRGRDPSGLLTFTQSTLPVSLAPNGQQTVRLRVRPNALEPLAEEHVYPFEVICWLPGTDKMHALRGELRYISF